MKQAKKSFLKTIQFLIFFLFVSSISAEYDQAKYQEALNAWKNNQFEQSLVVIREIMKGNYGDYALHFLAAHNYWRQNNFEKARAHFAACLKYHPDKAGVYEDLGKMYIYFKKNWSAIAIAKKGIKRLGASSALYNVIARAYYVKGDYNKSLENVYLAKAIDSSNYDSIFLEGMNNLAKGNYKKAEFLLEWALSIKSDSAEVLYNLALTKGYVADLEFSNKKTKYAAITKFKESLMHLEKLSSIRSDFPGAASLKARIEKKIN